jgi:hypothetical protein
MVHAVYVSFMQSMPVHKGPSTLMFHPHAPLMMKLSRCKLHLRGLRCVPVDIRKDLHPRRTYFRKYNDIT